jgi:hypothetical protein
MTVDEAYEAVEDIQILVDFIYNCPWPQEDGEQAKKVLSALIGIASSANELAQLVYLNGFENFWLERNVSE